MRAHPFPVASAAPGNDSPAKGRVQITLDETNGTLAYSLQHSGLQGTVTGLHLHRGGFNINGPHVLDLPASTVTPLTGIIAEPEVRTQLEDPMLYRAQKHLWRMLIKSGLTYLNVHSDKFVKGEIRGQLVPSLAVPFNVPLRPPMGSASQAQGEGQFFLSADGAFLAFRLTHTVANPTSAALVKGPVGSPAEPDLRRADRVQRSGQGPGVLPRLRRRLAPASSISTRCGRAMSLWSSTPPLPRWARSKASSWCPARSNPPQSSSSPSNRSPPAQRVRPAV